MQIYLIACVASYKNGLAIGRNGGLLFRVREDLMNFKELTSTYDRGLYQNVVVMGRKTWFSLPRSSRPLPDRLNLILTRDPDLLALSPFPKLYNMLPNFTKNLKRHVYFVTEKQLKWFLSQKEDTTVFAIGGSHVYQMFLEQYLPLRLFLTHIQNYNPERGFEPDTYFPHIPDAYKLDKYSDVKEDNGTRYRFLEYAYNNTHATGEHLYTDLLSRVLRKGTQRGDRTGVGTISIFGEQLHFDISESVPLFTTKRVAWKHVIHELLWFLRGDTDNKILQANGVKIWDQNTSREFLDNRGLTTYKEGILGPGYGWQMRFFGAEYSQAFSNTRVLDTKKIGGFDQIQYILDLLKTDPFSRRIMMSYWNPSDFHKTALLPCFPRGTRVLTRRGYKSVQDVMADDYLLTHKGNWKPIVNIQKTLAKMSPLVKIYLKDSPSIPIMSTPEHPFYVKDKYCENSRPFWCNAEDLDHKRHLLVMKINNKSITPNVSMSTLYVCGIVWGSGGTVFKGVSGIVMEIVNKHLEQLQDTELILQFTNNKIPEWVQDAPVEYLVHFIRGVDATHVYKNYTYTLETIAACYQLQRVYSKLGFRTNIKRQNQRQFLFTIEHGITESNLDYFFREITECYKVQGGMDVYNFEVADDNSYIVENTIVHNCHFSCQFYVEIDQHLQKHLSCHFTMRSNDLFLGFPFNIFSYTVLTYILAMKTGMKPKKLVYTGGDVHVYTNHLQQVRTQLLRDPRPLPKLHVNPDVYHKDFNQIDITDFDVIGYFPHPSIKADMAV